MPALLSSFKRIPFWVQILAGLVLGVALGLVARSGDVAWLSTTLTTVGELFIQLLKLAVPPLVFTAVVASIANLRGVTNAARLAGRTLMWFMATSLLAVVVGLGLGLLTNPGRGVTLDTGAAAAPKHVGTWTDFLTGIIPTNPVGAFVDGNVLQIVFLGAVVGAAALQLGAKARAVPGAEHLRAGAGPEGAVVGHPARPDRHPRAHRQGRVAVRLGPARAAGDVHRRRLPRLPHRPRRGLPRAAARVRPAQPAAASTPAPGRPSSSRSCPAPRSARCR